MAVDDKHKEYQKNERRWKRCRDAVDGGDTIKAAGEEYLPRLEGQQRVVGPAKSSREAQNRNIDADKDYNKYKSRAFWYNASGRTVDGLSGLIFRKDPTQEIPESMTPIIDDITLGGESLREFSEMLVEEVLVTARGGVLVDYPSIEIDADMTVADKEKLNLRPYWSFYKAESIINWKVGRVNNKSVLIQVRLQETVEVETENEFDVKEIKQIRVLDIDKIGNYRVRLFRIEEKGKKYEQYGKDIYPLRGGKYLDFIPFEFIGITPSAIKVQKPPIIDLVDVNLSHYRTMADLENGAHWAGSPTPVFSGDFITDGDEDDEITEIRLGSSSGIHLAAGGDAKYLEFTGQGLESLEKRAEKKEQMMAVLGARILAQEKKMVESAEAASIHRAGETSVLASIANSISTVITKLLSITRAWAGSGEGEIWFKLNTDFIPEQMDAQTLTALLQSWQSGGISKPVLFWNLQKGEIIQADKTFDEHEQEISDEGPPLGNNDDEDGIVA